MADLLPELIVLKPVVFNNDKCTYVYYSAELAHKCILANGTDVFDPYAKIEVETAKIDRNYVHLRFYHSNRYWARSEDDNCMVAVSKQPEEDRSKPSCTLFLVTLSTDGQIRFTHVHSGKRVRTDPNSTIIYADDAADGDYAFSFVDWDTLVKIPPRVAFNGDNGKYLQGQGDDYYYYFSYSDGNEDSSAYEVIMHPDGHLSIKSVKYGKFWNVNSKGWIFGDSDNINGDIDDKTIGLRNAKENKFCTRFTDDCLNASTHNTTKEAHLVVEELIRKRSIYDVEYRMEDARVYDEQPFYSAGKGEAVNESDEESSMEIMVSNHHGVFLGTNCYNFHFQQPKIEPL